MTAWRRIRASVAASVATTGLVLIAVSAEVAGQAGAQMSPPAKPQTTTPAKPKTEPSNALVKYTATSVNVAPGAAESVSIVVSRWSTDADRERLATALAEKGDAGFQAALGAGETLGYLWTSESLGYSLRYAHRTTLSDGTERVLLATDRRLGSWTRGGLWKAAEMADAPDYPFTLVELRVSRRGLGEGKMSLAAKVTVEPESKTVALENYAGTPVLLKDVRRQSGPVGATK